MRRDAARPDLDSHPVCDGFRMRHKVKPRVVIKQSLLVHFVSSVQPTLESTTTKATCARVSSRSHSANSTAEMGPKIICYMVYIFNKITALCCHIVAQIDITIVIQFIVQQ